METFNKTFQLLKRQIQEIARDYKIGDLREVFPIWFCQAMLADPEDEKSIKTAVIGGKNDRNVDILFISHSARIIYLGQTKYRQKLMKISEKPNDVKALAYVAAAFGKSKELFLQEFVNAHEDVRTALNIAWELVRYQGFAIRAVFVTTGKVSPSVRAEAEAIVDRIRLPAGGTLVTEYLVYDGHDCCRLQVDLEDLAPAIPYVEFDGVTRYFMTEEARGHLYSYVFAVPTKQIARIFRENHERLFARNIRLSKGEKGPVNSEIINSLEKYPEEFFYLNNGITFLGSRAEQKGHHGIRIRDPQIINGQQTTRMIAAKEKSLGSRSSVLVRVIARSADSDKDVTQLRQFIQRVVRATNFQNRVKLSELAANSPEHIHLERGLKSLGWLYKRKTGKKESDDTRKWVGLNKPYGNITIHELTTAVVACTHDPQYIRVSGIEEIFEGLFEERKEGLYQKLFPTDGLDAEHYLFCVLCHRLAGMRLTAAQTLARTVENHGSYYIAQRLYSLLGPKYRDRNTRRQLLEVLGARRHRVVYSDQLSALRGAVGMSWQAFFKDRGDGDIRAFVGEIATRRNWDDFFKRSQKNTKWRRTADKAVADIGKVIQEVGV